MENNVENNMEKKTYDVKKVVYASIACSLVLLVLIYLASLNLGKFRQNFLPDTGADWYWWKLPNVSTMATISVWGLYLIHQFVAWIMLYKIGKEPAPEAGRVGALSIWFLLVNMVFVALHIVQTMLFYDGLAQYVPVMSSQGSVIVMLVLIMINLNYKRGIFFGKKAKLPSKPVSWIRKYHGIYIAWAVIYTFWFHPTEGTIGHLMGFFYLFMLITQMGIAKTSWHTNIKWITILEVYVAVHGAIVALEARNDMWQMFLFGFLMLFVVTQSYGVIKKKSTRIAAVTLYVLGALLAFSGLLGNNKTFADIHQVTWIPIIIYLLVFVFAYVLQGVYLVFGKKQKSK